MKRYIPHLIMAPKAKKKKKNVSPEERLRAHMPILMLLKSSCCSPRLKKEVLKHCSNDCIFKICEVVLNVLKGNVPLSSPQKKRLASKKHILRRLVQSQPVHQRRRTLLTPQTGGKFWPDILHFM